MTRREATAFIQSLKTIRAGATDSLASSAVNVYPTLKGDGSLISNGTRICWKGVIKRAAVDLWDTIENNPDNAPTLWESLEYKDGYRMIPEIITVGKAFELGECGWWQNKLYESLLANNVYTPTQYAAGWKIKA